MKPLPPGWPRISPALFYADPKQAIEFLCRAFGFAVRLIVEGEDGKVHHSELELGEDGLVMVAGGGPDYVRPDRPYYASFVSPRQAGGKSTQNLCVHVDDVEAHCARARAAGAVILEEPMTSDYGPEYWSDRGYAAQDLEGHIWWFVQRLSTGGIPHGG
jgi:uncharacterized glyoxalase superfamily protein PhnB